MLANSYYQRTGENHFSAVASDTLRQSSTIFAASGRYH